MSITQNLKKLLPNTSTNFQKLDEEILRMEDKLQQVSNIFQSVKLDPQPIKQYFETQSSLGQPNLIRQQAEIIKEAVESSKEICEIVRQESINHLQSLQKLEAINENVIEILQQGQRIEVQIGGQLTTSNMQVHIGNCEYMIEEIEKEIMMIGKDSQTHTQALAGINQMIKSTQDLSDPIQSPIQIEQSNLKVEKNEQKPMQLKRNYKQALGIEKQQTDSIPHKKYMPVWLKKIKLT